MARNHLEEQLEAIRNQLSLMRWKKSVADESDVMEIEEKIKELEIDEQKVLKDLGVIK